MLIFNVVSNIENPKLEAKIGEAYVGANFRFAKNAWLVADAGVTAQEVCEKIDVKIGGIAGVIVTKVESYFGVAPTATWEWLKVKLGDE